MPAGGPVSEEVCQPWLLERYFLLQNRDLNVLRTSSTLLVSLPKSSSEQVQFVGPSDFELGLASFSGYSLKLAFLNCPLPRNFPCLAPKPDVLTISKHGLGFTLCCVSES